MELKKVRLLGASDSDIVIVSEMFPDALVTAVQSQVSVLCFFVICLRNVSRCGNIGFLIIRLCFMSALNRAIVSETAPGDAIS
jgi:hypothetical protein